MPTLSPEPPASAYTARLLALLGDADPFAVQEALVPALEAAVAGIAEADLRRPEGPGKWSILQVIGHLADHELVYGYRFRMILTHDAPPLERYDRDAWAATLRYHEVDLAGVLAELGMLRRRNLRLLRALTDEEWERTGLHSARGPESIRTTFALLAGHDLLHRRQIERIKQTLHQI